MRTHGWNEDLRAGQNHSPEKDSVKPWNLQTPSNRAEMGFSIWSNRVRI